MVAGRSGSGILGAGGGFGSGLLLLVGGLVVKHAEANEVALCSSGFGRFGQALDPNVASSCSCRHHAAAGRACWAGPVATEWMRPRGEAGSAILSCLRVPGSRRPSCRPPPSASRPGPARRDERAAWKTIRCPGLLPAAGGPGFYRSGRQARTAPGRPVRQASFPQVGSYRRDKSRMR